jgi:hypothetical protein
MFCHFLNGYAEIGINMIQRIDFDLKEYNA